MLFCVMVNIYPCPSLPTEVYHQQHTQAGGAVCGQALSGLVSSTGASGHGHQPPLQVPHLQWHTALRDRPRWGPAG